MTATVEKRVLLIIGGGIAAYKVLDLIRRLQERGILVRAVMTAAAQHFVTKLAVESLTGNKVFDGLFALTEGSAMGHIALSREADLVVVAPATADLLAKMAQGLASDLASTLLLATDKKILAAPAMNLRMWLHPATRRNIATLKDDGVIFAGPENGPMACGEFGPGRMTEPLELAEAIEQALASSTVLPLPAAAFSFPPSGAAPLAGRRVLVTSGPTREPIDPVRYLSNRSSGKQGHAIAAAAAAAGADTVLVSGPVALADPPGVRTIHVETAEEMLKEVEAALPADIFISVAAVADWRVAVPSKAKLKKNAGRSLSLNLAENPDILAAVAKRSHGRPALAVGFAAESEKLEAYAREKLAAKSCDVIVANDIGAAPGTFGGDTNTVLFLTKDRKESWPCMTKQQVAARLVTELGRMLTEPRP
ncbi:MAG TPA: bifunctional phosphopantothenoylcysteine decarboxylase/phosphopantothenate--cysteine ligase CoaBC [Methylocella sp.]|nr:bifunctional phosphopantothenoylcysteine decarboxylase/phosphopantothenate--cysteine ligase CoaBC [Methylocella sp.]